MAWSYGDIWETIADVGGDRICQVQGERRFTWTDFDRRANALAADLLEAGLGRHAKVAAYLTNGPEYLETYYAAFKTGLVPANVNFRYGPEEVAYLLANADAEAVVFHATYAEVLESVRGQLDGVKRWYVVDDGAPRPDWAVPYEDVVGPGADRVTAPWGRNGAEDHLLLYTGGTTGMPKGVMWAHDDLFTVTGLGGNAVVGVEGITSLDELRTREVPDVVMIPACPLMHGTGQFSAFITLSLGGTVVTLAERHFDPALLWQAVEDHSATSVVIVGDAFARPMLRALEDAPGKWDLSSILMISSSGVMWSQEVKSGLLEHIPQAVLFDSFGSSEAVGLGASVSAAGQAARTAQFMLGPTVHVLDEDGNRLEPGSGGIGRVGLTGPMSLGYYKDPEKTEKTFPTYDGVRYSIPGDYAQVNDDGTLDLLGRGSVCINTGGEKVFPEEVEEVLKLHDAVEDAVAVGVPDDRFGQVITAVVQPVAGATIDDDELVAHVRAKLARYKAPRFVVSVDSIGRSPSGKVDYKGLTSLARERLGR
ncbi:MAG: AMP-binding protein [Actinomycetota bacterium]|nr:AMP-binding protein [Actinomycetota bacterium]